MTGPTAAAGQQDSLPRLLYVTNSGMIAPGDPNVGPHNTATFTIGQTGALTPFGSPVPDVTQPRGIVFSPTGRTAYVADSGGDAVAPFRVGDDGALTPLSPPVPSGDFPYGIAMAPNGKTLYVAHFSSRDVAAFAVADDGSLSPLAPPVKTGHDSVKGAAITPDGRFLYVTHGMPSDQDPDVVVRFDIRPDGTLSAPAPATPIGVSGAGIVITPDGRFLYVVCQGSDDVWGFGIGEDGDLTPLPDMPQQAPDFPEGAAVAPDSRHLYVSAVGSEHADQDGLWTFAIEADGALTRLGERVPTGDGPAAPIATPDGKRVYVSNFRSDDVSAYDVLPSGQLREIAGSPFPSQGEGPAFGAVMVAPNHGPVAAFSASTRAASQETRFDASASADHDGQVARYHWDFGDGTTQTDGGPTAAHVYQNSGAYTVTVTVTDNEGCSTRYVSTGQSALCTGSTQGRATRTVVITQ